MAPSKETRGVAHDGGSVHEVALELDTAGMEAGLERAEGRVRSLTAAMKELSTTMAAVPGPVNITVLGEAQRTETGEVAILSAARSLADEVRVGRVSEAMAMPLLVGVLKVEHRLAERIIEEAKKGATPKYQPPAEWVAAAEAMLAGASPEELALAAELYLDVYAGPTHQRSGVTGVELPPYATCNPLVRAGWLAVARHTVKRQGLVSLSRVRAMLEGALTEPGMVDGIVAQLEAEPGQLRQG